MFCFCFNKSKKKKNSKEKNGVPFSPPLIEKKEHQKLEEGRESNDNSFQTDNSKPEIIDVRNKLQRGSDQWQIIEKNNPFASAKTNAPTVNKLGNGRTSSNRTEVDTPHF